MSNSVTPRWLRTGSRLEYGADYNPEQWPREVWDEDVRAMREAGVTIVSLAIFSWARIEPADGRYDFAWLDEVMDLLHANGISVDLATATASPPPWLTTAHPEILPVNHEGQILWQGGRQHWRPTSPVFREYALRLVRTMAQRYADHPALVAWHVSNELGCHNIYDYSEDAAQAFRVWLRHRYGTVEALNEAWGTAFWAQRYGEWDEILPPRLAASFPNPTQQFDFKRFSSDVLKDYLRAEREILRELTPDVPVTTNFMVMGETKGMNYADWAAEVDFVSNDHYRLPGAQSLDELSFSANLTGNIAGGRPWFLMEHSTSAVNWQPVNLAKRPGELSRDALTHVAHGADAVCYFQWRQSRAGAEKYHSGMVPHAGTDSQLFRDVVALGERLRELSYVQGKRRTPAKAAILFDWESWWASEQDSHPTELLKYKQEALDWYTTFLDLGVRVDVLPASASFDGYDLVVAPILHVMPSALADRLTAFVENGGHLVATYFSGIVDENDHIWLGGYPGPLRDLLGLRIEEFAPLLAGDTVALSDGLEGTLWSDRIDLIDPATEVLATYKTGDYAGRPAVTRRAAGQGSASYVSTKLAPNALAPLLKDLAGRAGVVSELPSELRGRVELTVREGVRFVVNRTDEQLDISSLGGPEPTLAARGVAVLPA
ncbi:beta-galactosidase [Paractinoplanes atraurantiacus]|uniref:Beta-galactosidase n=1 Tax=Paractinoplanes atraurantiacus TaxID=1036182 RepID=A0A285IXB7_9ACTN|nr:beta-galactosidase [Actinoplanes atraurantiacus]SNY52679.1 beta-galactosidase [Actinoplanes atraurantiacus]